MFLYFSILYTQCFTLSQCTVCCKCNLSYVPPKCFKSFSAFRLDCGHYYAN
ncbi:unnamed protein product [Coregonus sp. 'balchen']|nr:unnamed protein product [Coregonus sp. 'balchen']